MKPILITYVADLYGGMGNPSSTHPATLLLANAAFNIKASLLHVDEAA